MKTETMLKADLAMADLVSNGGALLPEQGNQFIRKLIIQPTLLNQIRVVEMMANTRKINKIHFASRILRRGTQGVALTENGSNPSTGAGSRSKPTTEQIELVTKEVIAEVRIPYDVIEDNIERGNLGASTDAGGTALSGGIRDTILDLIAERAALDLEELGLLGDTALSANTDEAQYLNLTNGFIRRGEIGGNLVDMGAESISKKTFKQALKVMPDQYLRNPASLRAFISMDNHIEYRDTYANRQTAVGDAQLQGTSPLFAYGVPVEAVSLMPATKSLVTHPLNLLMGIQRQIMMEFDKDITTRVYIIVLTARVDFQVEEDDAIVVVSNIG